MATRVNPMFEVRQLGGSWDACARNDRFNNDPWGGGRTNTIVQFVALGVVDQKVIESNSSTGGWLARVKFIRLIEKNYRIINFSTTL